MSTETETPLDGAIRAAGGITKMAKDLGLNSHAVIQQWRLNRVPAEHCPDIEKLTGVKCEKLRPDVNWAVLRQKQMPDLADLKQPKRKAVA